MNTLLCAPIQTQMQQKELSIIDYNRERKHANDQTVIFSDENQMDLTASHTVMITKGLSDCNKKENSTKIDTTSFLENLKHHAANSRIKKDLACPTISMSQNTFSEKINSDFIKRLKTGKYNTFPSTELDKENAEIPVYSNDSDSASSTHQMHSSLSVNESSSNRTRIFREQDDGMNLTQCHTACIQTWIPPCREANLGEIKGDNTIYGSECMELTNNYTIQVLSSENTLSERETQTQNGMNVTTVDRTTAPEKKTALKDKLNAAFQGSFPNPENKICITKCHPIESETQTVTKISNQKASTLAITSESICFSPAVQEYKTIFYSSSNDAMELTKCLSSMQEEKKLLKTDNKYSKTCTNPDAGLLREKTIYSEEDSMDITKSHTVAIDNKIFKHDQENIKKEITAIPIFEKEMMLKNLITMSKDEKMNVNYITVPQVSKERLQQSQTNASSVSLADKRMEFLAGEDMDLTKSHTTKLSQVIPTTFDLASKNVTKSYCYSKSPSNEWESLDKQVVIGQHSKLPLPQRKDSDDNDCSYNKTMYSEEVQTMDLTKSHTIVIGFGPSEVQEHSKINLEQRDSQLTAESRQTVVNIPGGNSRVVTTNDMDMLKDRNIHKPELLKEKQNVKLYGRKSTGRLKIDKTILFSEGNDDDMDITKGCTVKINHRSLLDKYDSHLVSLGGTSKTILYAHGQDEMEINRNHTTPLECKIISPSNITSGGLDKTVMSIDDHELEMTKSHTVFIDYQAEAKGVLPDRLEFQLSKKESLQKPQEMSTAEEIVSISKTSESNQLPVKGSQLTILEEGSNSGAGEETNDAQKPGFLNELSDKTQRRKSLRLKDKTTFPENDKSNRDITQSSVVETNNETRLEDRKDFSFVPLAETSKPVLSAHMPEDMELSKSQTTASEYKPVAPDEITTIPMDKTVMFVDNLGNLDVTKSHKVFIDCQTKEKVLHEYTNLGIPKTKNWSVSEGDTCIQEITKKPVAAHKHHMTTIIPSNTLFSDQSSMKTKFFKADIDEEVKGKEMEVNTLKQTKLESCLSNITDGKNVDFTSSYTADGFRSCDKNSSLPNVISSHNLDGNTKNKKKAYNCQMPNEFAYADILPSTYHMDSEKLSVFAPCPSKEVTQSAIALLKGQDVIEEPLGEMAKFNSKHVALKLAKDRMEEVFVDVSVASQPHLSAQQPPSTQKEQDTPHQGEEILSNAGKKTLPFLIGNVSAPPCDNEPKMPTNEEHFAVTYKKELNKSIETDKCNTNVRSPSNSALTAQVIETHANAEEVLESIVPSNVSCFSSAKPSLSNLNRKAVEVLDFQTVHLLPPAEQLLEKGSQAHSMSTVQATEICSLGSSNDRDEESKTFCNEAETTSVPLKAAIKDKTRRCSLGIFLPKLPNKRSCSITAVDDLEQILADATDLTHLETQPVCSKDSGIGSVAKLNSSLSQCISEETLPIYPSEILSSDSVSLDIEESSPIDTSHKEILPSENKTETCSSQKRTWVQEDDATNEKKIRLYEHVQDQEIMDNHTEEDINKNVNSVLLKSLSRTPSSCSSSLDSIKSDGLSMDVSTQHNSQMESQFLGDTICEETLREKLKDGQITIKEFFILLQVHILIQKPRQSTLSAKCTVNTLPTTEDLMLRQYVYGPKIQIYKEDCELLQQKIEELKVSVLNQDKLLADVNRNLWEKVKDYSDEELKNYGIYLNKIKSRYTKMTKVFTHQGKVALYGKLVHSAENEKKKLQIKLNELATILRQLSDCLADVEAETKNLENEEKNAAMEEWDSEIRNAEKELEQLKTEEEELQRKILEVETQKTQTLAQIEFIKEQTTKTEELLDQLSLSEWDIVEWSDDQAVFTFVYKTIRLIITFGDPLVGLPFLDKANRKINELSFQSLLDEDKASPSSLLVHKLIFQYIEEQESWKKKCTSQHQVPQMLQELSLVVNHCRLLGEEIEFLKRWGPNYSLMHVNVNNTELKLLFSSSAAFAKFEITLSLSAHYPLVPVPFTIQNYLGKTGHDEIAAVISKVPLEENYLKNVVKQIYQDLLKD
ncbi:kinetochore scaffold 1 isoform X2 [Apodemus sylvaticus]|nr:kinetochore scaffold 1 isoform X2 [Apodemus sylvaticus]